MSLSPKVQLTSTFPQVLTNKFLPVDKKQM